MFETQKSGNKTSSGEIGLTFRAHTSTKLCDRVKSPPFYEDSVDIGAFRHEAESYSFISSPMLTRSRCVTESVVKKLMNV